jgi:hypothetical protein
MPVMKNSGWRLAVLVATANLTLTVCAQTPVVRVVSGAPATTTVPAARDGKPIAADRQTVQILVTTPNGQEVPGFIVMARERESGVYWWMFQQAGSAAAVANPNDVPLPYALSFADDRAVGAGFAMPFLFVREVQGRQPDFAAIQRTAIEEIERRAREIQDGTANWGREINLVTSGAERSFFALPGSAAPGRAKVIAVGRTDGRWQVTLEGPNGDHLRVSLDSQYAVLDIRREPAGR